MNLFKILLLMAAAGGISLPCFSQVRLDSNTTKQIDDLVLKTMKKGNIPGISLIIVNGNDQVVRSYGFADIAEKRKVTSQTLFQLASCSKSYTALAVLNRVREGGISLDDDVARYLPWFHPRFKGKVVHISVLQLLHHTSGIPWYSISRLPPAQDSGALQAAIRGLANIELKHKPGRQYEYSSVNYDILALIIQESAHQSFESYLRQQIFEKLGLSNTTVGYPLDSTRMATGYKIAFFRPIAYRAPLYRSNNAAAYIISNAVDVAKWIKFQLGLYSSDLYELAVQTHIRDESVAVHDMASYALGWEVSLSGNGEISHTGLNPNFTSIMILRPKQKLGVALLANSNSGYTAWLGDRITNLLMSENPVQQGSPGDNNDAVYSTISIITFLYIIGIACFLVFIGYGAAKGKRHYERLTLRSFGKMALLAAGLAPFFAGLLLFPKAAAGVSWDFILVWSPLSFQFMVVLMVAGIAISYLCYVLNTLFPSLDTIKKYMPRITLVSVLSGIANMAVIVLITSFLNDPEIPIGYLLFYYGLALLTYLVCSRYVQVRISWLSRQVMYDIRMDIIKKVLRTSYQRFEKIDRGRIFTCIDADVGFIGDSADNFVMLITNILTVSGAILYLTFLSFWGGLVVLGLIVLLATLYYLSSKVSNRYFKEARNHSNLFINLLNGMMGGFKELSLHRGRRAAYISDISDSANMYREKMTTASVRMANTFIIGESFLITVLGVIAFGISRLFTGIDRSEIVSFVVIMLYLIGPINAILGSAPRLIELRVAWGRIRQLLKDIPASPGGEIAVAPVDIRVENFRVRDVEFHYMDEKGDNGFAIGPLSLEVKRGEAIFIVGGNGSGKTTLAKILTGLYKADKGEILINGKAVESGRLGEYFSTVFTPPYLFEKLYDIDVSQRVREANFYSNKLKIATGIEYDKNRYISIDLSGGQQKRLALLQCYLEDSPIYLFDELAADQEPGFRNYFYRVLIPEMKQAGKLVIAITHDDHYFDVADRVLRMENGQLEAYTPTKIFTI